MHSLGQTNWIDIWKRTVEESPINATNSTLNPVMQAHWGHIWKCTVEKNQTNWRQSDSTDKVLFRIHATYSAQNIFLFCSFVVFVTFSFSVSFSSPFLFKDFCQSDSADRAKVLFRINQNIRRMKSHTAFDHLIWKNSGFSGEGFCNETADMSACTTLFEMFSLTMMLLMLLITITMRLAPTLLRPRRMSLTRNSSTHVTRRNQYFPVTRQNWI